jgi:predicted enzyme related to lactoylglutathione lyase
MKQIILLQGLIIILLVGACSINTKENDMKNNTDKPQVTGIGGIFFTSPDPQKLKKWYQQHLGLNADEHGVQFRFRELDNPDAEGILQWSVFADSTDYLSPSTKEFMINYRVSDIEALVESLKTQGVTILDSIATYPYGKFVHIMDADNNKVELWEPPVNYKP